MTNQGEGIDPHRGKESAAGAQQTGPGSGGRHRSPRLWVTVSCLVVVSAAAVWVGQSDHSHSGGSSGDQAAAGGLPASRASADGDAFGSAHFFPADRTIEVGDTQARRSAARQGSDCADVVQGASLRPVREIGCTGYIGATYTSADGQVITTVTVLRFGDDDKARRAAKALAEHPADVTFALPDDTTQAPAAVALAPEAMFSRVAAVRGYVTVTSSAFHDARLPTAVTQGQLTTATRAVAYSAGARFMWL